MGLVFKSTKKCGEDHLGFIGVWGGERGGNTKTQKLKGGGGEK